MNENRKQNIRRNKIQYVLPNYFVQDCRSPKHLSIFSYIHFIKTKLHFSYIHFIKTKLHLSIRYPSIRYRLIRHPPIWYPFIRYPSIRYPSIQYSFIRYPSVRYPSIRYPFIRYPVPVFSTMPSSFQEIYFREIQTKGQNAATLLCYSR